MLEKRSGNNSKLMAMVTTTMAQPKLLAVACLAVQVSTQNRGLAINPNQVPQSINCSNLGFTERRVSESLGPTNALNEFKPAPPTPAPIRFSSDPVAPGT